MVSPLAITKKQINLKRLALSLKADSQSATLTIFQLSPLSPFLTGRMFVRRIYFGHFDKL